MAYKIQKGQVEGLREALLDLADDIAQTGVDLTTSINDAILSLTAIINSTGNYLDDKINDVDNTLTANLALTGMSVQNQINLLPDQTDYDNLDARLDSHDSSINLISGRVDHLSGVTSGLVDFMTATEEGLYDTMPLTGSGDLIVANGFKHRVNETFSISGNELGLYGDSIIIQSNDTDIQISPENDLLISGNNITEIRSGPTGFIRFVNDGPTMSIAGYGISDFSLDGLGLSISPGSIIHALEPGVEDGYARFELGRDGFFSAKFTEGGLGGIYLDRDQCEIKTSGSITLETRSEFSEINLESEYGINLHTASGNIEITSEDGDGTNPSVGNINLTADGNVSISALGEIILSIPTSNPGVAGALWRSGNYVMIST